MDSLRTLREGRGLTITELSRRSGVSRANLYNFERGSGNPTVSTLERLARVLAVDVGDLVSSVRRRRRGR